MEGTWINKYPEIESKDKNRDFWFELFESKNDFPFEIFIDHKKLDDLEEQIYLDFTEKKSFVHLKPSHFKKINSFKLSQFLHIPEKTKVGGDHLHLKELIDYNCL